MLLKYLIKTFILICRFISNKFWFVVSISLFFLIFEYNNINILFYISYYFDRILVIFIWLSLIYFFIIKKVLETNNLVLFLVLPFYIGFLDFFIVYNFFYLGVLKLHLVINVFYLILIYYLITDHYVYEKNIISKEEFLFFLFLAIIFLFIFGGTFYLFVKFFM